MQRCHLLVLGVFAVALSFSQPGQAAPFFWGDTQGPWCAVYDDGGRNCSFASWAQCRATLHGVGGACDLNRYYELERPVTRARKPRRAY
ncbi:MAG: DUF3551 domain-containing protein [Pseudolabrys sp.]|nr:DUF3551 domain-containing protein [Pseudolabrys sp.]MBV9953706.1 DUF3551 domain-containing protein [Pseudolabrys sp.]